MSNDRVYNVLIVGVGGQGIILASDVLGMVAARHGYDVKKNEIHGMAQRGGSVSSHVRFGKFVSSPIIKMGEADVLLSFEQIETLRYFPFLSEKGKVIVNDLKILPPAVFTGKQDYPADVIGKIKEKVQLNLQKERIKSYESKLSLFFCFISFIIWNFNGFS